MENNNKNSNTKMLVLAILAVVMVAALVAGGTYAWWSWTSNSANASENTYVHFVGTASSDLTLKITGNNVSGKKLAPTPVCYTGTSTDYGYGYTLTGRATAEAVNNGPIDATVTFVLSASLKPASGRSFASGDKSHLHWAIKEVADSTTAFAAGNCTGTNGATFATGDFSSVGTSATNINIPITYDVPANTPSHTKNYQIYVWLDSGYSYTNTGSGSVTDPMQDATVMLTFSNTSKIEQKAS